MTNEIKICMGSSCFARGNNENLEIIESFIKENNLEAKYELVGSRCENKCEFGPTIIVNEIEYHNVTKEELMKILGKLKDEQTISRLHS